jgi:hypothetical protein
MLENSKEGGATRALGQHRRCVTARRADFSKCRTGHSACGNRPTRSAVLVFSEGALALPQRTSRVADVPGA